MKKQSTEPRQDAYRKPQLEEFGTVRDLTEMAAGDVIGGSVIGNPG